MFGVVACETLYSEVERFAPDARVEYVPQDRHEFPVNVPQEEEIADAVQAAVDALDDPGLDRIVVSYANGHGELDGVASTHAPLVVSRADDCVSVFTHRTEPWTMGEPKEAGTYYLTRGIVDRGMDGYKLSRGFLGETDALRERFDEAAETHPDLRVTWPDGDRFRAVVERRRGMDREQVERFFHRVLGYYERVKLVDTGGLYDVHEWYAEAFAGFVERLAAEYGDGHAVDCSVVEGDLGLLRTLLAVEDEECAAGEEYVEFVPAGTPVGG